MAMQIAHSFARQWLPQQIPRRIAPRMAADCSFFLSSTAFTTVCTPYCSADGSGLVIPALVNGFSDSSRAVLLSGWQQISHSFSRHGFHDGLRAVLLSGWQRIAHSSARQWLFRPFACRIAQRLEAHCSFLQSLTAFPTVHLPYCSADGSRLFILPLVNSFKDGLRTVSRRGWQRIAHTSSRQRVSQRFLRRIAQQMAAYCSFSHSPTAFTTVCAPYCPADSIGVLILALVNCFHDGLRAVFLSGSQRIAHSPSR